MGNAVLLEAYTEFHPAPACMIVGGAFSSAREGAVQSWGIPRWMAYVLPDQWNNILAISRSHPPLLVVHSDADRANPLWMGERIYQAAPPPKLLVILHNLRHDAAFSGHIEQWWAPVVTFINESGTARSALSPLSRLPLPGDEPARIQSNPIFGPYGVEAFGEPAFRQRLLSL